MFNEIKYWKNGQVPGTVEPIFTFSSLFNPNSSYDQLKQEISALAGSFRGSSLSESEVYLILGNFFWSVGAGRCAVSAYKLAESVSPLPDESAARLKAIQKTPFCNEMFVITGELSRMERAEALFEIRKRGGLTSDNPVNTMDFLVLGSQEWSALNGGVASRKVQKAVELQKKGRNIQIISEEDFYTMLSSCE